MVNGGEEESKVSIGGRATGRGRNMLSLGRKVRKEKNERDKGKRMVNKGEEGSKVRIGGRVTGTGRGRKDELLKKSGGRKRMRTKELREGG